MGSMLILLVNGDTLLLCHFALVHELIKSFSQARFKLSPSTLQHGRVP